MRPVDLIVIHCSASPDGRSLARFSPGGGAALTTAQVIDEWHAARGFNRAAEAAREYNPHLPHFGYHYLIDVDGLVLTGRAIEEVGAHAAGFNAHSIGICIVGTSRYTRAQWASLAWLVVGLPMSDRGYVPLTQMFAIPVKAPRRYSTTYLGGEPLAYVRDGVCGHRDLSPDQDANGVVEPFEWLKTCPGFDVAQWIADNFNPRPENIFETGSAHA